MKKHLPIQALPPTVAVINDCRDSNAEMRQCVRINSLLGVTPIFTGASNCLEAGGQLIDALDALNGRWGLILSNVAPRNGDARKHKNGTPFCYFKYGETFVVASVGGQMLSLVKKFRLGGDITVLDTEHSLHQMVKANFLNKEEVNRISETQFRSLEFLPLVGSFLLTGRELTGKHLSQKEIPDTTPSVWCVDNFGNLKTTVTVPELRRQATKRSLQIGTDVLTFYQHLKDVPDGKLAATAGSSGLGLTRFAEIVIQGKSASEHLGLSVGGSVRIHQQN